MFNTLHLMFEQHYTELAAAVDLIAERIRALGFPAPGNYNAYARLSSIGEAEGATSAEEMIARLVKDQEAVVRNGAGSLPGCRARERRAERRPAHPADASAREDSVDAAVVTRAIARTQGGAFIRWGSLDGE